jgi:hypothetical protein
MMEAGFSARLVPGYQTTSVSFRIFAAFFFSIGTTGPVGLGLPP